MNIFVGMGWILFSFPHTVYRRYLKLFYFCLGIYNHRNRSKQPILSYQQLAVLSSKEDCQMKNQITWKSRWQFTCIKTAVLFTKVSSVCQNQVNQRSQLCLSDYFIGAFQKFHILLVDTIGLCIILYYIILVVALCSVESSKWKEKQKISTCDGYLWDSNMQFFIRSSIIYNLKGKFVIMIDLEKYLSLNI